MNARINAHQSAAALLTLTLFAPSLPAQVGFADYRETLLAGSSYTREYCLAPCACPSSSATGPLTGAFTLRYSHQDQWTVYYDVTDVDLEGHTDREPTVHYTGTGTYFIGGDFAYTHQLTLNLFALHEPTPTLYHFDSGVLIVPPASQFPAIATTVHTSVLGCSRFAIDIRTTAATVPGCPADIGSAGGANGPDGQLDNNDFIAFIGYFFNDDLRADRGIAGGLPGSDGEFDNNDFIVFIDQFFAGCWQR